MGSGLITSFLFLQKRREVSQSLGNVCRDLEGIPCPYQWGMLTGLCRVLSHSGFTGKTSTASPGTAGILFQASVWAWPNLPWCDVRRNGFDHGSKMDIYFHFNGYLCPLNWIFRSTSMAIYIHLIGYLYPLNHGYKYVIPQNGSTSFWGQQLGYFGP